METSFEKKKEWRSKESRNQNEYHIKCRNLLKLSWNFCWFVLTKTFTYKRRTESSIAEFFFLGVHVRILVFHFRSIWYDFHLLEFETLHYNILTNFSFTSGKLFVQFAQRKYISKKRCDQCNNTDDIPKATLLNEYLDSKIPTPTEWNSFKTIMKLKTFCQFEICS